MQIILLRHATRIGTDGADKYLGLDAKGEAEAVERGRELFKREIKPGAYFTSWFAHAKQTADLLRNTLNALQGAGSDSSRNAKIVELCTLTPQFPGSASWAGPQKWAGIEILEWIRSEAEQTGNDLRKLEVAVFVMHEPRLRQLLAGMTSEGESGLSFGFSEGVCLIAESLNGFLAGKGRRNGPPLGQTG